MTRTSLDDLSDVQLMRRFDTKYVVPEAWAPDLIRALSPACKLLEVAGEWDCEYRNTYFELPGDPFLQDHLRGKARRMKVRERHYVCNRLSFIEVKRRLPGGRTTKERMPREAPFSPLNASELAFLSGHLTQGDSLEPRLSGSFRRMTLVDFDRKERITLDRNLGAALVGEAEAGLLDGLIVVEVKQARPDRYGPAQRWLKSKDNRRGIIGRKTRISKYTVARLACDPSIAGRTYLSTYRRLEDARLWAENQPTMTL